MRRWTEGSDGEAAECEPLELSLCRAMQEATHLRAAEDIGFNPDAVFVPHSPLHAPAAQSPPASPEPSPARLPDVAAAAHAPEDECSRVPESPPAPRRAGAVWERCAFGFVRAGPHAALAPDNCNRAAAALSNCNSPSRVATVARRLWWDETPTFSEATAPRPVVTAPKRVKVRKEKAAPTGKRRVAKAKSEAKSQPAGEATLNANRLAPPAPPPPPPPQPVAAPEPESEDEDEGDEGDQEDEEESSSAAPPCRKKRAAPEVSVTNILSTNKRRAARKRVRATSDSDDSFSYEPERTRNGAHFTDKDNAVIMEATKKRFVTWCGVRGSPVICSDRI